MELEPRSLNIPLQRRERWGVVLIILCALAAGLLWFISSPFALVFAVSSVVALPMLWALLFPPFLLQRLASKVGLPQFGVYFLCFGYIALARWVLVPFFVRLLQNAVA